MANPRQRSKARSKTHRAIRTTSKQKAKKVTVKGPAALVENWDTKKTVLQNYKRLGLLSSLARHQAGGIEPTLGAPRRDIGDHPFMDEDENDKGEGSSTSGGRIPKGYGRIVRDAEGNVVDIVMAEDQEEEAEEEVKDTKTDVVRALEEYASRVAPTKPRTATTAETKWLRSLHAKYATDTAAMARDTRINRLQRTRGQIDESIRRAGGWEAVLATEDA